MVDAQWDMLESTHGAVAVVVCNGRVCRVCFKATPAEAEGAVLKLFPGTRRVPSPCTKQALEQLREYFQGHRRRFDLAVDYGDLSEFTRRVLQALVEVPYGSLVSYGELAARAGSPRAARAVGRVMATNPLPLLVPCHRVINADGSLGNYSAASGPASKACLIDFERLISGKPTRPSDQAGVQS